MKVDKAVIRAWTRGETGPAKRAAVPAIGLGLAGSLTALVQAYAVTGALSAGLTGQGNAQRFLALFVVAALVRCGLGMAQDIAASSASTRARAGLRQRVLARVTADGPGLLRRRHSADIASLLVDRIEALDGYFSRWIPAATLWIASPLVILIGVAVRDMRAAIILAACGILVPIAQAVFGIGAAVASRRQFQALTRLQARFLDRIRGIATIVLAGAAAREASALDAAAQELRHRTMRVLRIAFLSSAAIDVAMVLAILGIVALRGRALAQILTLGHVDAGVLSAVLFSLLLVPEFFTPLRALALAYQDRAQAANAAEAMHDLAPAANVPGIDALTTRSGDAPTRHRQGIALTLRDVGYSWPGAAEPTLSGISVSVPAGGRLVLGGASGSGKSTLIELLLGFLKPEFGQILFDGQDIASRDAREIAASSAWVGQNPILFAATLRDNILFGRPGASEAELVEAIAAASLDRLIASLPEGLETRLGEHGHGLSGGQAQRIAIARAFLKDAPLLLLDEPTAHLDPATEADILDALTRLSADRTVVLCGHSAATRRFAGKTLELSQGRVVDARSVA